MRLEIDYEPIVALLDGLSRELETLVSPCGVSERFREELRCMVSEEAAHFGSGTVEFFADAALGASHGILCARISRDFNRHLALAAKDRFGIVSH
jgi:hypothetical protein